MEDSQIFAELHPALRRFAAVVRPPDVDADDLVQEALARTLRRSTLAGLDEPLTYLRRVVVNLASNHRRSSARRTAIRTRLLTVVPDQVDVHPSDLAELLLVAPDRRAVMYLHIVEGATHDEISRLLDITPEASRARLSRGLRQLRLELQDQEVPR